MLFSLAIILMIKLQSFQLLFLAFIVALVGMFAALVLSDVSPSFGATLGILALIGILI